MSLSTTLFALPPLPETVVPVQVLYVIDGDTLVVSLNNQQTHVRLIGIDAPESTANERALAKAKCKPSDLQEMIKQGQAAKGFVKQRVKRNEIIYLEFDQETRDKYNRLLAYVYLKDKTMLNELLLKSGNATILTIPPNTKYLDRLFKAFQMRQTHSVNP